MQVMQSPEAVGEFERLGGVIDHLLMRVEPGEFLAQVLGETGDGLLIYRHSTDWASYFEPGHEWWGAFCWTVESPGRPGEIWVMAAATTD